jgi:hypothetical protein
VKNYENDNNLNSISDISGKVDLEGKKLFKNNVKKIEKNLNFKNKISIKKKKNELSYDLLLKEAEKYIN